MYHLKEKKSNKKLVSWVIGWRGKITSTIDSETQTPLAFNKLEDAKKVKERISIELNKEYEIIEKVV